MEKKISRGLALLAAGTVLASAGSAFAYAAPKDKNPSENGKKVWVCKYIGKPGESELIKDGKNPISVSVNSVQSNFKGDAATLIGKTFADAQGQSIVIGVVGNGAEPTLADCPTKPSDKPSDKPSTKPSDKPSDKPSTKPSDKPSTKPSNGTTKPTTPKKDNGGGLAKTGF